MIITDNDDAIRVLLEQAETNWRLAPDTRQAMRMGAKSMQRELDRAMQDSADYHNEPPTGTLGTRRLKTLEGALVACREKFNWYAQNESYVRMIDRVLDGQTT